MNNDIKKAIRDYVVSSVSLFATTFYSHLDTTNIVNNFNIEILTTAFNAGLNALWIAVPTTVGLLAHRKLRPVKQETPLDLGTPPDHL